MRKEVHNYQSLIAQAVAKATIQLEFNKHLKPNEVDNLQASATYWLGDFCREFPPELYAVVAARLPWRLPFKDRFIESAYSGVLQSVENKAYSALYYPPWEDNHARINDPLIPLLAENIRKPLYPEATRFRNVKLFVIGVKEIHGFYYTSFDSNAINKDHLATVGSLIDGMDSGLNYPVLPCLHKCEFKKTCFPARTK